MIIFWWSCIEAKENIGVNAAGAFNIFDHYLLALCLEARGDVGENAVGAY